MKGHCTSVRTTSSITEPTSGLGWYSPSAGETEAGQPEESCRLVQSVKPGTEGPGEGQGQGQNL